MQFFIKKFLYRPLISVDYNFIQLCTQVIGVGIDFFSHMCYNKLSSVCVCEKKGLAWLI